MSRVLASKNKTLFCRYLFVRQQTSFQQGQLQHRQRQSISSSRYLFCRTTAMNNKTNHNSALLLGEKIHHQHQQQTQKRCMGTNTVRLIALEDLPHGKAYKGDVVTVKAGFARNYLVPQKMALYATPQNFVRLNMVDPDYETEEQKILRLQKESNMTATEDKYLKESDLLKKYLKNKVLQVWRTVDTNSSTDTLHPGIVSAEDIRQKLSKQLKIDLDRNEPIHIFRDDKKDNNNDHSSSLSSTTTTTTTSKSTTATTTKPINFALHDEAKIQSMVDEFIPETELTTEKCTIQINRLGDYLAVIGLKGGYTVPLRFIVRQRAA